MLSVIDNVNEEKLKVIDKIEILGNIDLKIPLSLGHGNLVISSESKVSFKVPIEESFVSILS